MLEGNATRNGNSLRCRSHRARDKAWLGRGAVASGNCFSDLGGSRVDLDCFLLQAILGEDDTGTAEGVGLENVDPGLEKPLMNIGNDLWGG